jgi:flagellar basal body-associated protein FliL
MARTGNDTSDLADRVGATGTGFAAGATPAGPVADSPATHKSPRRARRSPMSAVKRVWIAIVIVVVVVVAGFMVFRLHEVFGKTETTRPGSGIASDPKPFNPKRVKYEIFGPPGTVATINYLDLDAQPQEVKDVALPWTLLLTTTAPAASANIVAQGDSNSIGCRITVNDEVKDEKTSNEVNAQTFCLVKSA